MKYLKIVKGELLYYQRAWPTKMLKQAKDLGMGGVLVKPLDLKRLTATDLEIARGLAKWDSVWNTVVESLSSPAVGDELIKRRALALLEAQSLPPGFLAGMDEDHPHHHLVFEAVVDAGDMAWRFYPDGRPRPKHDREHPFGEAVADKMWELLHDPSSAERVLISEAFTTYLKKRKPKVSAIVYRKEEKQLQNFISVVGDAPLTTEEAATRLRAFRNHLVAQGHKGSTVARYLVGPRAALSLAADTVVTDVVIPEITVVGSTEHALRYALSERELKQLIHLAMDGSTGIREYIRLFYLISIHCGGHGKEVRKTLTTDMEYNSEVDIHYLRIRGGKTQHRDRVVPLLDALVPYIQMLLPLSGSLLEDAGDVSDAAISTALSKPIKQLINPKATAYSIRHGFRSLAIARQIPDSLQAQLCGWQDGQTSKHQQRYGLSGAAFSESLVAKKEALELMFSDLLP